MDQYPEYQVYFGLESRILIDKMVKNKQYFCSWISTYHGDFSKNIFKR